MNHGLIIFGITAFFIADSWHDGKYTALIKSWKKYYKVALIAFAGISTYAFLNKHPKNSRELAYHAATLVKSLPIDKDAGDLLTPLLSGGSPFPNSGSYMTPQHKRMIQSGATATKRSVSETKKKYVAAQQHWKCGDCQRQLPAWFEVDHKTRLDSGGSNHVSNLVALCRDCHGKKTAMENL